MALMVFLLLTLKCCSVPEREEEDRAQRKRRDARVCTRVCVRVRQVLAQLTTVCGHGQQMHWGVGRWRYPLVNLVAHVQVGACDGER